MHSCNADHAPGGTTQVAAAAVFAEHGTVPWLRCLGLVVSAILIIAWLNLRYSKYQSMSQG